MISCFLHFLTQSCLFMSDYLVEEQQYKLKLVVDRDCFLELSRQMYEMRTVATGGVLKRYLMEEMRLRLKMR